MAFGSALGQRPSVSKYSAITAEYPVASGYSVSPGDVVDINESGQVIKEVNGDQVGGSFITNSSEAIALESGSSGDTIEIILAGTVEAPWISQGQEITSPGVYGFGALDGLLNVRPYWDVPSSGGGQ